MTALGQASSLSSVSAWLSRCPLRVAHVCWNIATGKGAVLLPAARRVGPKGQVTGIDLSGELLKEAERVVRADGLTNVELLKMDAEHLKFPDNTFDFVTCAFALFLFPDMEAALREMYRVCKPRGYVAMTNFNRTPPPFEPGMSILIKQFMDYQAQVILPPQLAFTPKEMKELLSRFGFRSVKSHSETNDICMRRRRIAGDLYSPSCL